MSEQLQDKPDMIDCMNESTHMSFETNNIEIETDLNRKSDNVESGSSKASRELKSLLALSKEANLDTNIVHKRKSIDTSKLSENTEVSLKTTTPSIESDSPTRPIIRVDYNKADVDCENEETKDSSDNNKICINLQEDAENSSRMAENITFDNESGELPNRNLSTNMVTIINNKKKDPFCWRCHHEKPTFYCETCPRSFHQKCLKHNVTQTEPWICPVCVTIMSAENLKQRSPAMRELSLEHFCGLLKFALKRMMNVEGHEPFINPVNELEFPEYKNYVAQPQDLNCLEKNIKRNVYGSPQAFEADAQWILHNSIIFNSNQSKLTSVAKSIMKICKHEMSEIENCANCYLNANTKKKTWFVEVCPKPHMLVWAKLKGFPYWPAKVMRTNSLGMVDVRFFGAHDRAWVPSKDCFLYCLQDPNSNKQKRNDINESIKELNIYIENLKRMFGEFCYAPYRVLVDPEQELKQLKILLPRYDPEKNIKLGRGFRRSLHRNGNHSPDLEISEKDNVENLDKQEDQVHENNEHNIQSDSSNCGSISDESSSTSNLSRSTIRMRGGFKKHSGKFKTLHKTSPSRKRLSCDDIGDLPPKLSRHNSNESLHPSDTEMNLNKSEASLNEIECPKLTDATKAFDIKNNLQDIQQLHDVTVENHQTPDYRSIENLVIDEEKSSITNILFRKLYDFMDEKPKEEKDVCEIDSLLDSSNGKIDPIVEEDLILPITTPAVNIDEGMSHKTLDKSIEDLIEVNISKVKSTTFSQTNKETDEDPKVNIRLDPTVTSNLKESVEKDVLEKNVTKSSNRFSRSTETKGTVEVIEVNITESIEALDVPMNIEDIVEAVDKSTVSIAALEPELEEVNSSTKLPCQLEQSEKDAIGERSNDSSLKTASLADESINPLEFLEVTENIPIQEKYISEEETPDIEKTAEDVLATLTQTAVEMETDSTSDFKKIKRRRNDIETPDTDFQRKKSLKLVNIDDIRNKLLDNGISLSSSTISESPVAIKVDGPTSPIKSLHSLLEKHLLTSHTSENSDVADTDVVIKSEPNVEDDLTNTEYMELKRKYLSALNISEKLPQPPKKPISMRTRSKSEENKIKLVPPNWCKVNDEISTNINHHSTDEPPSKSTLKRKEIFVKPLSKMQMPKQKARKSFPIPLRNVYPPHKKDLVRIGKPITSATNTVVRTATGIKPNDVYTSSNNIMYIAHSASPTNTVALLPPNQPITYTPNRGNSILTMVQGNYLPLTTATTTTTTKISSDKFESQNYIPLCGEIPKPRIPNSNRLSVSENNVITTTSTVTSTVTTTTSTASNIVSTTSATNHILDCLGNASPLTSDALTKTVGDIMCRLPPKLQPRPPGPLSTHFDDGLPSSAGTVVSRINSISHRLNDYFRGMLIELLHEMTTDTPEAEIIKLKLEIEELKYKHNEEIIEIKKNVSTILKDVQKSVEEERTRIIEETRCNCEAECVKRVEEAKSKQWCANCPKEAQFYCCWNTSYCDYPCQEKHWPKHLSRCTQNSQNSKSSPSSVNNVATTLSNTRPSQPLVIRTTTAPKTFTSKTLLTKPTKVIVNRTGGTKNAISYVRTTSGSHITLVESTPGNYELVGNGGPISVGGKFITGLGKIRSGNMVSVPLPSTVPSTSMGVSGNTPKTGFAQIKPVSTLLQPNTTVISDDE